MGSKDARAGLRILVVEDDPADVFLIRRELQELGRCEVVLAVSLWDALQRLQQGQVDVIITDLNLPDAWGLDAVSRLRQAAPTAALVALTGAQDQRLSVDALRAGAQDYLLKEGGHRTLAESVRYALERKASEARPPERRVLPFPTRQRARVVRRASGEVFGEWLELMGAEDRLPALLRVREGRLFVRVRERWLCEEAALPALLSEGRLDGVVFVLEGRLTPAARQSARLQELRALGGRVLLGDSTDLLASPQDLERVDGVVLSGELCRRAERAVPLLLLRALVQFSEAADWMLVGEGAGEQAARLFAAGCPLVVEPAR